MLFQALGFPTCTPEQEVVPVNLCVGSETLYQSLTQQGFTFLTKDSCFGYSGLYHLPPNWRNPNGGLSPDALLPLILTRLRGSRHSAATCAKTTPQSPDFVLTKTSNSPVRASINYDDRLTSLQNSLFSAPFDSYELFLLLIVKGLPEHDPADVVQQQTGDCPDSEAALFQPHQATPPTHPKAYTYIVYWKKENQVKLILGKPSGLTEAIRR